MGRFRAVALAVKLCIALRLTLQRYKESLDDTFYNYLTMGLLRTLNGMMRVCRIKYEKRGPCTAQEIFHWEQVHGVSLSKSMSNFYSATNGFYLHWSFNYGQGEIRRVGRLNIPRLRDIKVLISASDFGDDLMMLKAIVKSHMQESPDYQQRNIESTNTSYMNNNDSEEDSGENSNQPQFCTDSKIFALHSVNGQALVCMIYEKGNDVQPKFFLLQLGVLKWKFLASSFIEYWRMSVAHLGLPSWELIFSSIPLPAWAEQLYLLLAPHLIIENEPRLDEIMNVEATEKSNKINNNIFFEVPENQASKSDQPTETK